MEKVPIKCYFNILIVLKVYTVRFTDPSPSSTRIENFGMKGLSSSCTILNIIHTSPHLPLLKKVHGGREGGSGLKGVNLEFFVFKELNLNCTFVHHQENYLYSYLFPYFMYGRGNGEVGAPELLKF